jgi:hypothetical protein
MSKLRTDLKLEPLVSNSYGFTKVSSRDVLNRDVGLKINLLQTEKGEMFQVMPFGPLFPPEEDLETRIPFSPRDVFSLVQTCREVWEKEIVNYHETDTKDGVDKNVFPFQESFDMRERENLVKQKAALLAKAGDSLFYQIFQSKDDSLLTVEMGETRRHLAERLREVGYEKDRSLIITITSDSFFIPWGVLYTHPNPDEDLNDDGTNFEWEGFWGYRHTIEQNTKRAKIDQHRLTPGEGGLIVASINIDEGIDKKLNVKCIEPQVSFFNEQSSLKVIERRQRPELEKAVRGQDFKDQIVYFYCHGSGAGEYKNPNLADAFIALTDGVNITGQDIANWLRERNLASSPIVFINACQSGQMTTIFYQTLAAELLKRQAAGLIGTQITVPAVFAQAFSMEFFEKFLNSPEDEKVRVGPLLRGLTRSFILTYKNPLGLIYSLYRGLDCFVVK